MEFGILGPIEVWRDGVPVRLGGPKQRTLLAALLLRPGGLVAGHELVDLLWGDEPPATAPTQIRKYVSQLRLALGSDLIRARGHGYAASVDPERLDLTSFDRGAGRGRELLAAGHGSAAAEALRTALSLWRGPALADGTEALLRTHGVHLEERRLATLVDRIQADLDIGRHAQLIGELQSLVARHPLQERLRGQLMLALHRSDRTADALEAFRNGREALAQELGMEPGLPLQQLHTAILKGGLSLCLPAQTLSGTKQAPGQVERVPSQLPPAPADFTGRAAEVAELTRLLADDLDGAMPPAPVVISGQGGVGKTALALHAGHRLAGGFPDGRLYAALRDVTDPAQVLAHFLGALGVDGPAIPEAPEERAALYRTRLGGRRMLVVLDDAASAAQVRPLLPGSASCAVLITSRTRLTGLEGARLVDLDVFAREQAIELLTRVLGSARVAAEPRAAAELARFCGHLPLALRIAAARLTARPHWRLADLAGRLADEHLRLGELAVEDLSVRACVGLGYRSLGDDERRAFRLLGLLEIPDFAGWVPAPLLETSLARARDLIEALVDARLLEVVRPGRYRFHDLVRLYAYERGEEEESPKVRREALLRTFGMWFCLTEQAEQRLHSHRLHDPVVRDPAARPYRRVPSGWTSGEPGQWFEAEKDAMVAAVEQACASDLDGLGWLLADTLTAHFDLRGLHDDWQRSHQAALAACVRRGDPRGQAVMRLGLAQLAFHRDRPADALHAAARLTAMLGELAEPTLEADTQLLRCTVLFRLGRGDEARPVAAQALALARRHRHSSAEAHALRELGGGHYDHGRWDSAEELLRESLRLARQAGWRRTEAQALQLIALVNRERGRLTHARMQLELALSLFEAVGDRAWAAITTLSLGLVRLREGSPQARELLGRGLAGYQAAGVSLGKAEVLRVGGEFALADGDAHQAVRLLTDSVRAARDLGAHYSAATALRLLGRSYAATGDAAAAKAAWLESRNILHGLDQARLATPSADDSSPRPEARTNL